MKITLPQLFLLVSAICIVLGILQRPLQELIINRDTIYVTTPLKAIILGFYPELYLFRLDFLIGNFFNDMQTLVRISNNSSSSSISFTCSVFMGVISIAFSVFLHVVIIHNICYYFNKLWVSLGVIE